MAAVVAEPFLVHTENALRVTGAVLGKTVDCGSGVEPNNQQGFPYDAIAVPGAGVIKAKDGTYKQNAYGEMRLKAAAIAYYWGLAPIIVLLDGQSGPQSYNSSIKTLQEAYADLAGEGETIPAGAILAEDKSINTATNMAELSVLSDEHNLRKILIETNRSHLTRATLLACARELAASPLSAESLTLENAPRMPRLKRIFDRGKEQAEVLLIAWDPAGVIPTFVKKKIKL